ncbi:MAG: hypothetical protein ACTSRU_11610 [Candidatus Hodarchaeales archaeon]
MVEETIKEVLSIRLSEKEIAEAALLLRERNEQHWKFVEAEPDSSGLYTFIFEKSK